MGDVTVIPLVDEGLGNSAYLADLTDGHALAVEASRDRRLVRAGHPYVAVLDGGPQEWAESTGQSLEVGW